MAYSAKGSENGFGKAISTIMGGSNGSPIFLTFYFNLVGQMIFFKVLK